MFRETKTGDPREVKLTKQTMAILHDSRPDDATDDDHVLTVTYRGESRQMDRFAVAKALKRIGERKGIKLHAHMLRHSNVSHSIRRGANVIDVRDRVGHASIATTNLYAHPDKLPESNLMV
ncbi:site-specific integrase [Chloroflexi bacterium TSY]|nr:site-specific integrase [Chloroflexi bacterium TSY]